MSMRKMLKKFDQLNESTVNPMLSENAKLVSAIAAGEMDHKLTDIDRQAQKYNNKKVEQAVDARFAVLSGKSKSDAASKALNMFADVASGGGDPIDALIMELNMDMDQINALARDQGYADADEWAESYSTNEGVAESGADSKYPLVTGDIVLPGRSGPLRYEILQHAKSAAARNKCGIGVTKSGSYMLIPKNYKVTESEGEVGDYRLAISGAGIPTSMHHEALVHMLRKNATRVQQSYGDTIVYNVSGMTKEQIQAIVDKTLNNPKDIFIKISPQKTNPTDIVDEAEVTEGLSGADIEISFPAGTDLIEVLNRLNAAFSDIGEKGAYASRTDDKKGIAIDLSSEFGGQIVDVVDSIIDDYSGQYSKNTGHAAIGEEMNEAVGDVTDAIYELVDATDVNTVFNEMLGWISDESKIKFVEHVEQMHEIKASGMSAADVNGLVHELVDMMGIETVFEELVRWFSGEEIADFAERMRTDYDLDAVEESIGAPQHDFDDGEDEDHGGYHNDPDAYDSSRDDNRGGDNSCQSCGETDSWEYDDEKNQSFCTSCGNYDTELEEEQIDELDYRDEARYTDKQKATADKIAPNWSLEDDDEEEDNRRAPSHHFYRKVGESLTDAVRESPEYTAMKAEYEAALLSESAVAEEVNEDMQIIATGEEANALARMMALAGQESVNAEEEVVDEAEYANEPDEEYIDAERQLVAMSGGLNGPKGRHFATNPGDNALASIKESLSAKLVEALADAKKGK